MCSCWRAAPLQQQGGRRLRGPWTPTQHRADMSLIAGSHACISAIMYATPHSNRTNMPISTQIVRSRQFKFKLRACGPTFTWRHGDPDLDGLSSGEKAAITRVERYGDELKLTVRWRWG